MSDPGTDPCYEIHVERHVGEMITAHFPEMAARHTLQGTTVLSGRLPDQSALFGVLVRIRDLGLTLLAVTRRDARGPAGDGRRPTADG